MQRREQAAVVGTAGQMPDTQELWYVWLLNTALGEAVLGYDRRGFARTLWAEWSPTWPQAAREAALASVLPSFDGPDWARVALSAYRSNVSPNEQDRDHDDVRRVLAEPPPLAVPALVLRGADDGVEKTPLDDDARRRYFPAGLEERVLPGVGDFPQREAPEAIVRAVAE